MATERLIVKFKNELEQFKGTSLYEMFETIRVLDADYIDIGKERIKESDARNMIAIGKAVPFSKVVRLMASTGIRHFVQSSRENFVFDIVASSLMLSKPSAFQNNPQPFFTRKIVDGIDLSKTVQSVSFALSRSVDKREIIHRSRDFLAMTQRTLTVAQAAGVIIDEMIMNALYDAPSDVRGLARHAHIDRSVPVQLEPGEEAKLFLSYDDSRLLIGCEDPFGSVNEPKVIGRLRDLYGGDQAVSPIMHGAGAGLGLKAIIDYSCGFYMVVQRKKRTLVCCSLPLNVSLRKFESLPKHIHFCSF